MAPPLTEVEDIQLQFTTHLATAKGRKAKDRRSNAVPFYILHYNIELRLLYDDY